MLKSEVCTTHLKQCAIHTCFSVLSTPDLVCCALQKWCAYWDFISTPYLVCYVHFLFYSVIPSYCACALFNLCCTSMEASLGRRESARVPGRYWGLIRYYFGAGYTYEAIVSFLDLVHDIKLPLRSLKRILSRMGLRRRGLNQDLGNAMRYIEVSLIQE